MEKCNHLILNYALTPPQSSQDWYRCMIKFVTYWTIIYLIIQVHKRFHINHVARPI